MVTRKMSWFDKLREIFRTQNKIKFDDDLETPQQYRERWRSIYIIYFTMFLVSLGFSIIVTGVWPYLNKLDPTAGKEFMGFVVAANPFAQMLFSPLVGWWSNKVGSIRIPVISSLMVFTLASAIYSSLELFDNYRKYWMLGSRFLVGISSANIAACRSYLSAATRYSERTTAVSMISLAQVLGFIVGPAIQAAVVPFGNDGVWLIPNKLRLNMYTACGWINVILSLTAIILFSPQVFKERKIAAKEAMLKQGKESEKATWKGVRVDYFSAWTLIVAFFVIVFNFMLLETLGTPLIMDQFAWSTGDSLWYMGVLLSGGAVVSIVTFLAIAPLSKKFSEVKIMIWGGFLFMVLGRLLYIPFSGDPPLTYDTDFKLNLSTLCTKVFKNLTSDIPQSELNFINQTLQQYNKTLHLNTTNKDEIKNMTLNCGDDIRGCPSSQEWCTYIPAMTVTQFMFGFILTAFGYPIGVTLIQTLFSKLLGSRPQGVWMGLMTGSGCLSRVMGPVFVTQIYEEYGTAWTFGTTTVMMALCLFWLWYFNKKLEPIAEDELHKEEGRELKEGTNFVSVDLQEELKRNT